MPSVSTVQPKAGNGEDAAKLLQVVEQVAAELHPQQRGLRHATLESELDRDLGFDSLGRVELLVRIEKQFGVALPEQLLATIETPGDLLRALSSAGAARPTPAGPPSGPAVTLEAGIAAPAELDTLTAVLDWHAATHPERPHLRLYDDTTEGEVITYGALRQSAGRIAAGLLNRGLPPGQPVVLMLPTGRDYFFSFFGVLLAGGVPVPIYPPTRPSQIEEHLRRHAGIVANAGASMLITDPDAKRVAQLLRLQVECLDSVATPEELAQEAVAGDVSAPPRGAQDVAFLQYTSGSTGQPKGVVLSHANLLANIRAMAEALRAGPEDVFVSWLPLYHDMGLIGAWLGSLVYGAHYVVMPPLAFLARPQRWLWAIHRFRATLSAAPNFGYELCLRRIADEDLRDLDLSSWRAACNGAEAVSPETVEGFCARFADYGFRREAMMPVYGLAESSVGVAFPPLDRGPLIDRVKREAFTATGRAEPADPDDAGALRFIACGRPLPGHEIRIVDKAGRELPERREGRLEFRGPSSTSGYYHNPERTRRLFHGDWLHSEDLAYIAEGDVFVTGRTKDIIIRAGRNIYPEELERAVSELAGVQKGNVAVFGSRDPVSGTERLVVLAEVRSHDAATLDRLRGEITALASDLTGTAPDDVVLAPLRTVLKTSSGKIRRAASRTLYEAGQIGAAQPALWRQTVRLLWRGLWPQVRRLVSGLGAIAYAAYAWTLVALFAPALWLGVVLLPLPAWRWAAARWGLRLLAWVSGTALELRGPERLPPAGQPCIYVSNHASYLDGFCLTAALPRQVSFVAKAELQEPWFSRIPLRRIGAIFVERFEKQKGVEDARRVVEHARAGHAPLFFAEGTFTRMPGLLPFHMGAFAAAAEAGLPIVPLTIRGTRAILRGQSWFPRRGTISIVVAEPIEPAAVAPGAGTDTWSRALALRDATRREILRRCGEPDLALELPPLWSAATRAAPKP